ncbi:MAG: VIT domain-containing protein, partial [Planctomycetota bacterium]
MTRSLSCAVGFSLALLLLSTFFVSPVAGQTILTAGVGSRGNRNAIQISTHRVSVAIQDGAAVTSVEQVFTNRLNRQLEGIYLFQIPTEATIDRFSMFMNGKEMVGEVMESAKARAIYESIVHRRRDPGLVELAGYRKIRLRVFPIPPRGDVKLRFQYSQLLNDVGGLYEYTYPIGYLHRVTAQTTDLELAIRTTPALKTVYSPTHKIKVERKGENEAKARIAGRGAEPCRTFRLYFDASDRAFGLKILTYRTPRDGGFFMLMASPKTEFTDREITDKDLVFVIDTSGSMQGMKITQAKAALAYCLKGLRKGDRFDVIPFASTVRPYAGKLVDVSPETMKDATAYVNEFRAGGGTDIYSALQAAFSVTENRAGQGKGRLFMVVFLTDGKPTVTTQDPELILKSVKQWNAERDRLFVFGVGLDVDPKLLDRLARENRAAVEYVKPEESLEIKLSAFFDKIAYPVLSEMTLDFGGVRVDDRHPVDLPDLFRGSQLVVFGRFREPGETAITLNGTVAGKKRAFHYPAVFPGESRKHDFIPRLWARRRTAFLMDEIRLHGFNAELKEEIVRLGKRWGIVTPYTSFLVVEDGALQSPAPAQTPSRTPTPTPNPTPTPIPTPTPTPTPQPSPNP